MWREISLALVTLVALAGLAAGVVLHPSKDEGFLKDRARAAVWRTTGRELAVDGYLRLDLGCVTTLKAEGVSLSNAPWAGPEDMARAGRLRLGLALEGGVLRLQPFALRGPHGSSVNGQLVLDGQQSQPHLTASLQGRDIRIGLAAAKDQSPETCPPMELDKARAVMSGGAAVVTSGLSLLAKSFSDRFPGSDDPCGEARRTLAERDARSD